MKKNRVLLVFAGLRLDVDEGAKHRLNCFINEYASKGNDVTVLAFCKTGLFRKDRRKFMNPNAKWLLFPYILPLSKHILITKVLDFYLGFILACITWLHRYDIVQMELKSYKISLCRKSLYITDIHGDSMHEVSEIRNLGHENWFIRYLNDIQRKIVRTSSHCIAVSENLKSQIEDNTNLQIPDYSIISCGVDYSKFSTATRASLPIDLSNRIVIGYSGGLQAWQNFDKMIDIIIELRKTMPEIFLLVYTNNSIASYTQRLAEVGEENYFVKALASSEVPSYLKLFDAGLLLRDDLLLNRVSSPTKICEYLAAGVPLICTQYSGDYNRSVYHGENGFVLNETSATIEEIEALSQWLKQVKANRRGIADACEAAASKRTFKEEFDNFYRKISLIINAREK